MRTGIQALSRLRKIQEEVRDILSRLQALEEERVQLLASFTQTTDETRTLETRVPKVHGKTSHMLVPLPCGEPLTPEQLKQLQENVDILEEKNLKAFVTRMYPLLRETSSWPMVSKALQKKFGMRPQQIAGFASHSVGAHAHKRAHEVAPTKKRASR